MPVCRYSRPYLSAGAAQCTLLLLHIILPACAAQDSLKLGAGASGAGDSAARSAPPCLPALLQAVKGHLEELLPVLTMLASGTVAKMLQAVHQQGGRREVCPPRVHV